MAQFRFSVSRKLFPNFINNRSLPTRLVALANRHYRVLCTGRVVKYKH